MIERVCKVCQQSKMEDCFRFKRDYKSTNRYYRETTCSRCKNQDRIARRYNLTLQQYLIMMKDAQCAICGATDNLVVDHDHISGKIRGVLCKMRCNTAIGSFRDDPELILKAAIYVENGK